MSQDLAACMKKVGKWGKVGSSTRAAQSSQPRRAAHGPKADAPHAYPRNRNLCNFPVSVRGNTSRNSTARGYLYGATLAFT